MFYALWILKRLVFAYLVWATLLFFLQRNLLFPGPSAQGLPTPVPGRDGLEVWERQDGEARIEAWFLPGHGVQASQPGPAVIFAHGNGELIDFWPDELQAYRKMGISVLLPEYRGYGRSTGSPSESELRSDFQAFYDQLAARPEVDAARIVFHGRSLGGGVVLALAEHRPPAALILQSTFSSVRSFAKGYWLPGFLVRDSFESAARLRNYSGPVWIAHGQQDELIPPVHALELLAQAQARPVPPNANQAAEASLVWMKGGHNDTPDNAEEFFHQIQEFLKRSQILPTAPKEPTSAPQ